MTLQYIYKNTEIIKCLFILFKPLKDHRYATTAACLARIKMEICSLVMTDLSS